jgi:hypothetical protein
LIFSLKIFSNNLILRKEKSDTNIQKKQLKKSGKNLKKKKVTEKQCKKNIAQ